MDTDGIITSLVYLAASFILFFIGSGLPAFHPKVKVADELVEKDNLHSL